MIERLDPVLAALSQLEDQGEQAAESSGSAQELIDKICDLLADGDASVVEVAGALQDHPQLRDFRAEIETARLRIGEYDFDAALEIMRTLQHYNFTNIS